MKIFDNYTEYRREAKLYAPWKYNQNLQEAKRIAYIKQHPISQEQMNSDIKRAEAVLNCVDIMDEFSQTRAEDMEVVTNEIKGAVNNLGMYISAGLFFLISLFSKNFTKNLKNMDIPKLLLPLTIIAAPFATAVILSSTWGAGNETKASRIGRAEAINTKLRSVKQFAELTNEQERKVDEIAKTIYIPPHKEKELSNANAGIGLIKSLKIITSKQYNNQAITDEISYKTNSDKELFDKVELTEEEILNAKKDKQLIQNVAEKIDIASQDYAEDIELATTMMQTVIFAGGALIGFVTHALCKLIRPFQKYSKIIAGIVGITLPLIASVQFTKIQKQASRIARFNVKEDFRNNPDKIFYVDDEKINDIDGSEYMSNNKKDGFFKFISKVFKDNKKYNEYLKTEYIEKQKEIMARESIELTPEQEQRAKQLQQNVFKMYNKLDEKSQDYSESVEALGEIVLSLSLTALMLAVEALVISKVTKNKSKKDRLFAILPTVIPIAIAILFNIYITKEQKKASKVANMLAIKDLDDYRNFVNYEKKLNAIVNSR
ncbi:MAG: hypothetical protein MJ237_04565 [bacterium]|nr:hypothetical protein [bacterium]